MRSIAPGGWTDDRFAQSKHFVGINYVAIHRIATQWQQASFKVYHEDDEHPEGKRPVTRADPPEGGRKCSPYDLVKLLKRPNKRDSFGKLMYRICQQKYLTGSALDWMVPNLFGVPFEMYVIPTATAIPQPVINPEFPEGYYRVQPLYPYGPFSSYPTPSTSVGAPIPAQWVMRFQYPHPLLLYEGYAPQTALRAHIDQMEAIDRSRTYSMNREVNPSAVLNFNGEELDALPEVEIDRIAAYFENQIQGPENAGRLYVATPGAELTPWGSRPLDMDYQSGWDQVCGFILGGFGITKPAAGLVDDSSYSTLYATLKQLYTLTLKPDLDDVGDEMSHHLAPFFGDDLIVEVSCPRIDDHDIVFSKVDKLSALKGMPKSVVRLALSLMELPTGEELVKELSEAGQEAMGPGAPGGPQNPTASSNPQEKADEEGKTAANDQKREQAEQEATRPEPPKVAQSRPTPGSLSNGSLGPRMKNLNLYDQLRKVLRNGHSH